MNKENYYISCVAPNKCVVMLHEPGIGSRKVSKYMSYIDCEKFMEKEKAAAEVIQSDKKLMMTYLALIVIGLILGLLVTGVI